MKPYFSAAAATTLALAVVLVPAAAALSSGAAFQVGAALHVAKQVATSSHQLSIPSSGPSPPTLPDRWTSKVTFCTLSVDGDCLGRGFGPIAFQESTMSEDIAKSRRVLFSNMQNPFAGKDAPPEARWVNFTQYYTASIIGNNINGQTLLYEKVSRYDPMFGWLKYAHFVGNSTVKGTQVSNWLLVIPNDGGNLTLQLNSANEPVRYVIHLTTTKQYSSIAWNFTSFHAGASTPEIWSTFNESAYVDPPVCDPRGAEPQTMQVYIFHPAHNFNISNQDVGDVLGDTTFTCVDILSNQSSGVDHDYAWITQWSVDYWPRFGQYLNCNGYGTENACLGANSFLVGHESGMGFGAPIAGQCVENQYVGEWYSLPAGGKCPEGVAPDGQTCSWRATRVKTIDGECLFQQQGFKNACQKDATAPWKLATAVFAGAFNSDNVTTGGCPRLPSDP